MPINQSIRVTCFLFCLGIPWMRIDSEFWTRDEPRQRSRDFSKAAALLVTNNYRSSQGSIISCASKEIMYHNIPQQQHVSRGVQSGVPCIIISHVSQIVYLLYDLITQIHRDLVRYSPSLSLSTWYCALYNSQSVTDQKVSFSAKEVDTSSSACKTKCRPGLLAINLPSARTHATANNPTSDRQ